MPGSTRRARRITLVALGVLAAVSLAVTVCLLTGQLNVVVTHGVSMRPLYHQGDLVFVWRTGGYHPGQIAAYHLPGRSTVALHRIIASDNGTFTFKGDNNQSVDPWHVPPGAVVGRAVLRVPGGGIWFDRLAIPLLAAIVVAAFFAGDAQRRRRTRRRGQHLMTLPDYRRVPAADHRRPGVHAWFANSRLLGAATVLAAVAAALAAVLAGLAWAAPAQVTRSEPVPTERHVSFSYVATVGRTAAYDGTTVTAPAPIFRKIADAVTVQVAYTGPAGALSDVAAQLSTGSGWRSVVPLRVASTTPTAGGFTAAFPLDLASLQSRAVAAAAATGVPAGPIQVTVSCRIDTGAGQAAFTPALRLTLTPLQLTMIGDSRSLTVSDTTEVVRPVTSSGHVSVAGRSLSTGATRTWASIAVLVLALVVAGLGYATRRRAHDSEGTVIRRRYHEILVDVEPIPMPPTRPVVDVTDPATLAKLARRYGLLMLHWSRSGTETFVVHDENTTYRYRTPGVSSGEPTAPATSPAGARY